MRVRFLPRGLLRLSPLTKVYLKVNLNYMKSALIGLKELRKNADTYISQIEKGRSFIVVRRSKPVFKISPPDEDSELWESVIDFTKIKKGGILLKALLSRI